MTLVVTIRPEPGCAATVAAALRLGLDAVGFPLYEVQAVEWTRPEPETFDALLIGSANALRHGGAGLRHYCGKPAYAVGEVTARAASAFGLNVVATGSGGLQPLLAAVAPEHRRLLRLTGRTRIDLLPPPGITVNERVVYESAPRAMPAELARLLTAQALAGAVVLLHSAEAGSHFAAECARLGIARARLRLAALAPRIAAAAGDGWTGVFAAETPTESALLALAMQLCNNAARDPPGPNSER